MKLYKFLNELFDKHLNKPKWQYNPDTHRAFVRFKFEGHSYFIEFHNYQTNNYRIEFGRGKSSKDRFVKTGGPLQGYTWDDFTGDIENPTALYGIIGNLIVDFWNGMYMPNKISFSGDDNKRPIYNKLVPVLAKRIKGGRLAMFKNVGMYSITRIVEGINESVFEGEGEDKELYSNPSLSDLKYGDRFILLRDGTLYFAKAKDNFNEFEYIVHSTLLGLMSDVGVIPKSVALKYLKYGGHSTKEAIAGGIICLQNVKNRMFLGESYSGDDLKDPETKEIIKDVFERASARNGQFEFVQKSIYYWEKHKK